MNDHLKNFILKNLLTKKGTFNNRTVSPAWWEIRNYTSIYKEIFDSTQFLPQSSALTQRSFHIVHNLNSIELCIHCKKQSKIFKNYSTGYSDYCSRKCSLQSDTRIEKIKTTNLEKYGNICSAQGKDIQTKIKKTNLEKYGTEYYTQTEQMKSKSQETKLKKYSNQNYNNPEKTQQTCLIKYGKKYSSQNTCIINKIQETKGLSLPQLRNRDWLVEQNKTKNINQIAQELNITPRTVWLWMNKFEIDFITHYNTNFKEESEILDWIVSLGVKALKNDRKIISPKELDIFIPEYKLAIEMNGLYYHSENKHRHIDKLNLTKEKGIRLLQFWDYEWLFKKEICKSIISSNLGLNQKIYARKCTAIELSFNEYKGFINENHIQGAVPASIRYGLVYDNQLVSCIAFAKPRGAASKKYQWELIRYANKLNINIIGGFSKLLKHSNLTNIISYCDLMKFTGNMYKSAQFTKLNDTAPGYFYFNRYNIKSREYFQKHKLPTVLNNYDPSISTEDNIFNNGWKRVYNCGNSVWAI